MHSKTASTSPIASPVLPFDSATLAATSFAKASLSSIVVGLFIGTKTEASANLFLTAKSKRSFWISAMITVLAPETLHIAAQRSPTAPAPNTRTVLCDFNAARREACIATLRGSRRAPNSRDTVEGSLYEGHQLSSQQPRRITHL